MKTKLTTLAAMILMSTPAMASSAPEHLEMNCTYADSSFFGISIQARLTEGFLVSSSPAQIVFYGPRLDQHYTATLSSKAITTRVETGTRYEVILSESASIHLKDIDHVPGGYERLLGFTGTLTQNDKQTQLNCSYIAN